MFSSPEGKDLLLKLLVAFGMENGDDLVEMFHRENVSDIAQADFHAFVKEYRLTSDDFAAFARSLLADKKINTPSRGSYLILGVTQISLRYVLILLVK